jgi:hypothetical protein
VRAEFDKPKKNMIDGQKIEMSEPIIGMNGHALPLMFSRHTIKQLSTGPPEASALT